MDPGAMWPARPPLLLPSCVALSKLTRRVPVMTLASESSGRPGHSWVRGEGNCRVPAVTEAPPLLGPGVGGHCPTLAVTSPGLTSEMCVTSEEGFRTSVPGATISSAWAWVLQL